MRKKKKSVLLAALGIVLVTVASWLVTSAFEPDRPNVILISIDTLRPDRMGVYGHRPMGRSTTPFLDELAAEGAVFVDAVSSSSWTLPGHYALFTGLPDDLHGMVDDRVPSPEDVPLLAELFQEAGYQTAGFYSGPYLHPFFGFDRGFDTYESCFDFSLVYDMPADELEEAPQDTVSQLVSKMERSSHEAITSDTVTGAAERFVLAESGKPFFLFLHYFDVHNDYTPPPPHDTRFGPPYDGWVDGRGVMTDPRIKAEMDRRDLARLMALYDGEISWVDENIRLLFRAIDRIDPEILENTIVVITSDHGEEFFEHGMIGHRHNLAAHAVRIPLIVSFPGRVPAGTEVAATAPIYDIAPTICDLAGIATPPIVFGSSLCALIEQKGSAEGAKGASPRPALLELTTVPRAQGEKYVKQTALRCGSIKLITVHHRRWSPDRPADFTGELLSEEEYLFDLDVDPGEKRDISSARPELLHRMRQGKDRLFVELKGRFEKYRGRVDSAGRKVPDWLQRSLEALGYGQ